MRWNLDAGWPAPETFPTSDLARLAAAVLADPTVLGYTAVRRDERGPYYAAPEFPSREELALGDGELRRAIAGWSSSRVGGAPATAAGLAVTSGSAQAIALCAAALVDPGDAAIVEWPSFPFAERSFASRGAEVRRVPVDRSGLDVDALEAALVDLARRRVRPRALYVIPTLQLPTGTILPLDRRLRLLELARRFDLAVVEDAVYSDLWLDTPPPPSLLALDEDGRVLQVHSLSKVIAPGLRIGWVCGDPALVRRIASTREDLGVSRWLSRTVAAYLDEGLLEPHVASIRAVYRRRRDVALRTLLDGCGDLVEVDVPDGGFYLWVRVDDAVDLEVARRDAGEAGVTVRGWETLAAGEAPREQRFRLGFAHLSEAELERGVEILAGAIRGAARR